MSELRRRHGYSGIAITGHDGQACRCAAAGSGFLHYFVKPGRVEDFLAAVESALLVQTGMAPKPAASGVECTGT
jgi:hypothetical protein